MEALSVVHPAGEKISSGQKIIEIRSWPPPRIPLLNLLIVENRRRLDREGDEDPGGLAVALVDIVGVHNWTPQEAQRDGHTFAPDYHAWEIANVRRITTPFRVPAKRLIYPVPYPAWERESVEDLEARERLTLAKCEGPERKAIQ